MAHPAPLSASLALAGLALALAGCRASVQAGPRSAVAGEPVVEGFEALTLDDYQGAVQVRFARPVVDVETVGPTLAEPPVALEPPTPFEAHWSDRRTLVLRPSSSWDEATRYRLRLSGALAKARGAREHAFDVLPPRFMLHDGYARLNALQAPFQLLFSAPVRKEDVARRCSLLDPKGAVVALRLAAVQKPHRYHESVTVEPVHALARSTRYRLGCDALLSPEHTAPFATDGDEALLTHGDFALRERWPAANEVPPAEQAQVCLSFSTPVELAQLDAHVQITPAPAGKPGRFTHHRCGGDPERDDFASYASSAALLPDREYSVRIDPELRDEFGQRLGQEQRFTVRVGPREPGLWTATGMMTVLERGRPGHAIGTMNTSALRVRCARLSPLTFPAAFAQANSWVLEDGYGGEEPPLDGFAALGLVPRQQRIATLAARNAAGHWPIELDAACGGAPRTGGFYLFDVAAEPALGGASAAPAPARLLANHTDLALVAKRGRHNAVVWVTRLSTGAPVAGALVRALDGNGAPLGSARSEHDGLARLELREPGDRAAEAEGETYLLVETADDAALVGTEYLWTQPFLYAEHAVWVQESERQRVFVHTDRGVYRPGETVLVHGLVRDELDRLPAVPARGEVTLELELNGAAKIERRLPLSEFGSFHAELVLPRAAAPSSYWLQVSTPRGSGSAQLSVAEYRPATFELRGGPERATVLEGEPIRVPIAARYLFDAPVADARVGWSVERRRADVHAPGFPEFAFSSSAPELAGAAERTPARAERDHYEQGRTDAAGRAHLQLTAVTEGAPVQYLVRVWAQDRAQDVASRSFELRADSGERYVGTRFVATSHAAGEPLRAELVVVDREGRASAGTVELELRAEERVCDASNDCQSVGRTLERRSVDVPAGAPAQQTFSPRASGSVHLIATVRDAAGRAASSSASTWLDEAGVDEAGADAQREPELVVDLRTDKPRYRAGERARLALHTPLRAQRYLLTLERADVLDARVVGADAAQHALPLGVLNAPNAFVSMSAVLPRSGPGDAGKPRAVFGTREVEVQAPTRALALHAAFEHERVRPGQEVRGEITVSHLGVPVQAELAVAVVQESVLQLTDFATPDPSALFHARRELGVTTVSNLPQLVDAADAAVVPELGLGTIGTIGHGAGGGVGGFGGGLALRDEEPKVAFWAPALRSGPDGKVRFQFTAPGGLGAYRLMAVAAARDDRVGSGEQRLTVQQPLAAQLVLPRFLSRGDRLEAGVLVHDHTGQPGAVALQLRSRGLALSQAAFAPAGSGDGAELALTEAVAGDVDQAWFEAELGKRGEHDRVGRELPVRRALESELRVLQAGRARELAAELRWPAGILREQSQLQLTVDRAGLAPLAPRLAQVLAYPYGCSEQTVAALGSLLAARELAAAIVPELVAQDALAARVREAQDALLAARTHDGHFALFPGMAGAPWLTALVLESSLAARDAGHPVPDALLAGAREALHGYVARRALAQLKPAQRASYALAVQLLARAGTPLAAAEEALWRERATLSDFARAQLLRAWAPRGLHPERTAELIAELARERWLPGARDPQALLESAPAVTGAVLHALVEARAPAEQQARLARWLSEHALDPAFYFSTRDTAWALAALGAWAAQAQVGASRVRIGHGRQTLWQGELHGAQVVELRRSAAQLGDGTLWVKADGEVTVAIRRKDVSASSPRPAFSRGLSLQRRYLDPRTGRPLAAIARGDVVQVVIALGVDEPVAMLALSDPLPAGFEPLDPSLTTGRVGKCMTCSGSSDFDYVRRRDDRVEAFAQRLRRGTYTLRYLVRATTAGSFSAPGATALAMYNPDPFARSAVSRLQVRR